MAKKITKKSPTKTKRSYIKKNGSLRLDVPNGSKFTAVIDGDRASGRIFKESDDKWYLCQDKIQGEESPNKLGYKYSWYFDPSYPIHEDVKIKTITPDPKFEIPPTPPKLGDYTPRIYKGYIKVGCTEIPNEKVREMIKYLKD